MIFIAEVFPLIKQWVNYTQVIKVMIKHTYMHIYIIIFFLYIV